MLHAPRLKTPCPISHPRLPFRSHGTTLAVTDGLTCAEGGQPHSVAAAALGPARLARVDDARPLRRRPQSHAPPRRPARRLRPAPAAPLPRLPRRPVAARARNGIML